MSSIEKYNRRGLKTSYVSTIIGISLVLFVVAILLGGAFVIKSVQQQAKENLQIDIFFKPEFSDADIKQIEQELRTWDYFKEIKYVDSDQAIRELTGLNDEPSNITSILGGELIIPTNISFHLHEKYANQNDITIIEEELLKAYPEEIDEIYYNKESIADVNLGFKRFVFLFSLIATLLVFVAIALINNTVRLALFSQRFLIKTMQLVGATPRYIRRPFLLKSIFHGILSAILGLALFLLLIYIINNVLEIVEIMIPPTLLLILFASILSLGILISYLSTWSALNKYLRMNINDLY